jgi:hypothetical protein
LGEWRIFARHIHLHPVVLTFPSSNFIPGVLCEEVEEASDDELAGGPFDVEHGNGGEEAERYKDA